MENTELFRERGPVYSFSAFGFVISILFLLYTELFNVCFVSNTCVFINYRRRIDNDQ